MNYELPGTGIQGIQNALEKGEITAVSLVKNLISRIENLDKKGPALHAAAFINPEAETEAEIQDQLRKEGKEGPLCGIPVLLKDNIETGDGMPVTAGSIALKDNTAERDAAAAEKLRRGGAVILGKAAMSEWAFFMTEGAPSGFSALHGQVKHPYGPEKFEAGSVGGSSSGSAAAVAAGYAPAALGTETSGSILSPASACSVVGIKPTTGLISRRGIIPLSGSQDTAGPIACNTEDAALLLEVLAGTDAEDDATARADEKKKNYSSFLRKDGLKGAKIGMDTALLSEAGSGERRCIEEAVKLIRTLGADVKEIKINERPFQSKVLPHEFKHALNDYLSATPDTVPVSSLKELLLFNEQDTRKRMPFGQTLLELSDSMSNDPLARDYLEDRQTDLRLSKEEGLDHIMEKYGLDALLSENNRGAAMPAKAGYPSITVPAGYTSEERPVGITFTARAWEESKLISFAYAYEQASKKRRRPNLEND
ncbi:MAG: amidase [Alkalicoccus sp.]|uniref:Amidase n=1 Tax=Alkalicoccus sp. TaxID=2005376 RepID=A0A651DJ61_9BACI|nr:MAG: amidase [Alkalicoccus sp.]